MFGQFLFALWQSFQLLETFATLFLFYFIVDLISCCVLLTIKWASYLHEAPAEWTRVAFQQPDTGYFHCSST